MATEFISNSWLMPTNANAEANRVSNYSLNFSGTGDKIQTTFTPPLADNSRSISIWFYTSVSSTQNICGYGAASQVSGHNGFDILTYTGGYVGIHLFGTAIIAGGTYNVDAWNHYVITYDGTTLQGYLNGVAVDSNNTEVVNTLSTNDFIIGQGVFTGFLEFSGKITEVSIFDYSLSASQVTDIYGTGSAIGNPMSLTTKPVAYYPLGDAAFNGEFLATNNATELYENYSLAFDGSSWISTGIGLTDLNISTQFTLSLWVKIQTNTLYDNIISAPTSTNVWDSGFGIYLTGSALIFWVEDWNDSNHFATSATLNNDQWYHVCCTFSTSNGLKLYIDAGTPTTASNTDIDGLTNDLFIGSSGNAATRALNGNISNVSFYNSELLSAQVTTLYNSGKPFNLNTFAVTPVSWWRLGASGSSFDGTNWTVLDEIGTNNGTSANMTQSDLVDGVGATGSGTSSGMSSGTNKTGDAPYSSNNAVSYNMSVTAESTSVPT